MDVDLPGAVSSLGLEPLDLEDGEIVTSAVVILRVDSPSGGAGIAWVASPGLTHWEQLGMLTDVLDTVRAAGREP